MPRSILASHVVLLACASLLVGATTAAAQPDWATAVAAMGAATAVVLFVTELFSGMRATATVAAAGALTGLAAVLADTAYAALPWALTWLAVAFWFHRLAYLARADR